MLSINKSGHLVDDPGSSLSSLHGMDLADDFFHGATWGAQHSQSRTACRRIESYQCRIGRVQHSYIACVVLAWLHVRYLVCQSGQSMYQAECDLPHDYLVKQLKSPTVRMLLG
ncbi:MAG: hypothetical protein AVDCRST_MAG28-1040 [uncultured Rubrobacteraceae bacterium]|uniref:Uncharacterized protein n=1 Tax=uncultured Rubrobacteraceae bacterium TaxID=349277 RepID=A0A6J4QKM7_9ACTN|nr:MAG: hypothetical protein AVDCRST_MAG28-1040 [uncultured Rubrobacteraceae bacterium]